MNPDETDRDHKRQKDLDRRQGEGVPEKTDQGFYVNVTPAVLLPETAWRASSAAIRMHRF
jgi:hypothetical protein